MKTSHVDTLIIGSGVAASAISQRLLDADSRASILILEAGARVKMLDGALWQEYVVSNGATSSLPYARYYDYNYPERDQPGENMSVGKTQMPLNGARAFNYGGSTIHWGGWSFRLKPEDFQLYTNTGIGIDWPFGYDALEPYYCQAEHYIGVSGDSQDQTVPRSLPYPFPAFPLTLEDGAVAQAMASLGIAYSNTPIARHGMTDTLSRHAPCQTTGTCKYCPFGARFAANLFLDDMTTWGDYPNLQIRLNSVVQSLVMASRQRVAGAAGYDRLTGEPFEVHADRVIVAAGTIESAKLLLRSRSDHWETGVGNQHDLVGRNIITHPYFTFSATLPQNPQRLQPEMNFPTLCSRYFDSPAEQARGKWMMINPPGSPGVNLLGKMQAGATGAEIDAYATGPTVVQIQGMVEIFSELGNRVTSLEKRNHNNMEETVVDFSQPPTFNQRLGEIAVHVDEIFRAMGATPQAASKASISWRADHAACTVRMADDEAQGVVDADLRVHGVNNLYVCSNGTFPNTGAVNPTLTLTALSLRLADHLIGAPTLAPVRDHDLATAER
jgi:choline dehydrogenase-like flavoprotein